MSQARSFSAVSAPDARVLILGSMPGLPSLKAQEYYANPRNAFWRIMAAMLDFKPDTPYELRLKTLKGNQIALWDVLEFCYRDGSLDSAIRSDSAQANSFAAFLDAHNEIGTVYFNGAKARQLWDRHVAPDLPDKHGRLVLRKLPSTSPAYAAMPYDEKLRRWLDIKRVLLAHR